jgi:hypothetical protein
LPPAAPGGLSLKLVKNLANGIEGHGKYQGVNKGIEIVTWGNQTVTNVVNWGEISTIRVFLCSVV